MIKRSYILSFILLLIGSLIYFFFREPVYFLFNLNDFGQNYPIIQLSDKFVFIFFKYNIPDLLWCMSYFLIASTFSPMMKRIGLFVPIIMELSQLYHICPGTFDIIDLYIYIALTFLFAYTYRRQIFSFSHAT